MYIKKVLAAALAFVFLLSISACGDTEQEPVTDSVTNTPAPSIQPEEEKLVIYTVSEDLEKLAERYTSQTGVQTQVILLSPEEYISGSIDLSDADVIAANNNMLPYFYEDGLFEDLSYYGTADKTDALIDLATGTDGQGVLRALGFNLPVGVIVYRRDLAKEIFGTDDPVQTAMLFSDFLTITETAKKVREKGCYVFADTNDLGKFADEAWIIDGKLNLSKRRLDYLSAAAEMYQERLIPSAADSDKIFAYPAPAWAIPDILEKTAGKSLGLCSSPGVYIQGTWLGVSSFSQNKKAAWEFVEFVTLDERTAQWWMETSGQAVSLKSMLEALHEYEHPDFGGQKIYSFLMSEAESKTFPAPSIYDEAISAKFAEALVTFKQGLLTKAEAIAAFRSAVKEMYPQLKVE